MASITQLKYLLAVHKHKHFGRAAKECNVSQPSLSAQLQKLEEELDVVVFDRSKKPILTSDKGLKIIDQAKKVLKEYDQIFDLSLGEQGLKGNFNLGVIPTLSPYVVPRFIHDFSKKYPEVNLNIYELTTNEIVRKLYDDELDGGLLVTPLKDEKLIERSLFLEPFKVFVSNEHDYCSLSEIDPKKLKRDDLWLLKEGHCFRNQILNVCGSGTNLTTMPNIEFESGSLETIINLIRAGRGYTLLPHLTSLSLSKKEQEKNLKNFIGKAPSREVGLVHSRSFLKEEILDALSEVILSSIPNELTNLKKSGFKIIDF